MIAALNEKIGSRLSRVGRIGVRHGLPPALFGYRSVRRESVRDYFERNRFASDAGFYQLIHGMSVALNPLPVNIPDRGLLPDDRGWWGYSFQDVPTRESDETFIATLPDCIVAPCIEPVKQNFWTVVLNRDRRALDIREMMFRPWQAKTLRRRPAQRVEKATWVVERVFHNYSHWLTAHLPKLLLLKSRGELADILLPRSRPSFVDDSLRMFGIHAEEFQEFEPERPLLIDALTILGTDRFRPELLRSVAAACPVPVSEKPHRRVFISRARAARRRLVNESEIWPLLEAVGFEKVFMEDLSFDEQVALMRQTSVLVAPHGAGLTNMMFCPPETWVVEIADLGFPNPNFYAVASAMNHRYWVVAAEALGDVHPLQKDLKVEKVRIQQVIRDLV